MSLEDKVKQVKIEKWSDNETQLVEKYFNSSLSEITLYQRLQKLNPNRTYEAMSRKIRRLKFEGKLKPKEAALAKLKVGFLDIETTDLRADWGYILTWYIKTEGKKEYYSGRINQKEILRGDFDKRVTRELLEAMSKYDVLWAHYGSDFRFDVPYIRTRAYSHGLEDLIPKKMELFIKDTYPLAKKKLKLSSNKLGNIAENLGIKEKKSPVSPVLWRLARIGNEEALDYVEEHNKRDVGVLEKVYKKLSVIDDQPMRSI